MSSEFDQTFLDRHGRQIELCLDEDLLELTAYHQEKVIGRVCLKQIECDSGDELKITWMYLDMCDASYKHSGIGRKILEILNEYNGGPVSAGSDDGTTSNDGSHLTGDAPGFIKKMQASGLVSRGFYGCDD